MTDLPRSRPRTQRFAPSPPAPWPGRQDSCGSRHGRPCVAASTVPAAPEARRRFAPTPRPRHVRLLAHARPQFAHAPSAPSRPPPSLTLRRNGLPAPPQFPSAPLRLIASPPRQVRFRSSSLRLRSRSFGSRPEPPSLTLIAAGPLVRPEGPVPGRHDAHDLPPSRPRPSTSASVPASPFSKARVRAHVSPPARVPGHVSLTVQSGLPAEAQPHPAPAAVSSLRSHTYASARRRPRHGHRCRGFHPRVPLAQRKCRAYLPTHARVRAATFPVACSALSFAEQPLRPVPPTVLFRSGLRVTCSPSSRVPAHKPVCSPVLPVTVHRIDYSTRHRIDYSSCSY